MNTTLQQNIDKILSNIKTVFVGRHEVVELSIITLFSGGHLLIVDLPGVGKTTLAKSIAKSISGKSNRVQFTPDLLPSDITGINIYIQSTGEFKFHRGPIFTNVFLADEINRATPRTQSSLLEAMEENQVSIDGVTYPLTQPFLVISTQNPIEVQGTFPLPEAQLDRFMVSLSIGYPSREDETRIMTERIDCDPINTLSPVLTLDEVEIIKNKCHTVFVDETIKEYILQIVTATRNKSEILIGASPRASISLMHAAQTNAFLNARDYVIPEDVKKLAKYVLAHRIILKNALRLNVAQNAELVEKIVDSIPVPRKK